MANNEPAVTQDEFACPRCDGEGGEPGVWVCTLCGGSGCVVTIERKTWDD